VKSMLEKAKASEPFMRERESPEMANIGRK
jgi:hypothetical protein